MSPVLELAELSTGYQGTPVVRDLSLRVEAGEVVALLGPNGAGKTSTLLAASGLLPALTGEVWFDGKPLGRRTTERLARDGLVLIPEDRAVFPALTVKENLRLVRGDKAAVPAALDLLPALQPLMNRKAGLLSGGEQQMLALARAFVAKPKVLLVDELSLGLAPVIVARLLPVLSDIATSTGAGVILVEQHVEQALAVATRGYVLRRGRCAVAGTADDLTKDRNLLTATYLGEADAVEVSTS